MKMKLLITGILTILYMYAGAQGVTDDMLSITEALQNSSAYTIKVKVSLYGSASATSPAQTMRFHFRKNGNDQLLVYDHVTMMANKKEQVMINTKEKQIVYAAQPKPLKVDWSQLSLDKLKPKEKEKPKEELVSETNGVKHYRMTFTSGWFKQVDIYLDAVHNKITKIVYLYQDDKATIYQKVVLDFEKMETSAQISADEMNLKNYIVFQNGQPVKPSDKYADYHLIITQNPFE